MGDAVAMAMNIVSVMVKVKSDGGVVFGTRGGVSHRDVDDDEEKNSEESEGFCDEIPLMI